MKHLVFAFLVVILTLVNHPLKAQVMAQAIGNDSFGSDTKTSYVSIDVNGLHNNYTIGAELTFPKTYTSKAAVVIAHGSNGLDSRGEYHKKALNAAGFATLEIDLWSARGALDGSFQRPAAVHETLPDAFAALKFLADLPQVDADKIGILGFSWGGVITMLTREQNLASQLSPNYRFAAHVAFYPVCWVYTAIPPYAVNSSTGKPIQILTGELDDYDTPESCHNWVASLSEQEQSLAQVHVFKNAYHAFNTFEEDIVVQDPYSHLGQGGEVTMKANVRARKKSNQMMVRFFNQQLK
ncbi:dienelactone hydrolase family protein [Thalassotalea ganghwensis]